MIPVYNRFHGHGSLRYVYKNGTAIRSHLFTLKFVHNSRRKKSRLAVVVSKKIHKGAVGRNRIRRRLYEILRSRLDRFNNTYDIVVIVSSGDVLQADFPVLESALDDLLKQGGLYNPEKR